MNSTDAFSETNDAETGPDVLNEVASVMETLAPSVARRFGSGNFAAASGVIALFRAARSFRKGDRKRALVRAGVGLFWVGVALALRRRKKGSSRSDASRVADTGPNLEEAVEPGDRETEHATGAEVVNTTDADIEESDTAPEVSTSSDIDRETDEDVDQRDVVETDGVEDVDETGEGSETEGEIDSEAGGEETGSEAADEEFGSENGQTGASSEGNAETEGESLR